MTTPISKIRKRLPRFSAHPDTHCTLTLHVQNPWAVGKTVREIEHLLGCDTHLLQICRGEERMKKALPSDILAAGERIRVSLEPSRLELVMSYIGPCVV